MRLFLEKLKNFISPASENAGRKTCEPAEERPGAASGRKTGKLYALGLILVMLCSALLACGNSSSGYDGPVYRRLGTGSGSAVAAVSDGAVEEESAYDPDALYMIENIDSVEEHIIVRDLDTRRLYRYSYGMSTSFKSKHGGHALLTDFHPGLVVTLGELDSEGKLKELRISDKAFVMEDVTNYTIDTTRNLFSIGQTNYEMNSEAEIFSGDAIADLTTITENDSLRVVGIDKKIISLSITTGHGYLFVTNTGTFSDTLMQIGEKIFIMVDPTDMTIEIPEGTYAVTVAKDGYGGTKEVTVGRGETVNLNLDELKGEGPKTSQITFSVGVDNAHIYLDGQEVPTGGAMTVKYGRHALKVTAEGYDDWSRTLYVNSPTADIALDISEAKQGSSTGETNNAATSTSSAPADTSTGTTSGSSVGTGGSTGTAGTAGTGTSGTTGTGSTGATGTTGTTTGTDRNGDGVYDEKDAQLDYLSTISNMLNTMNSNNN